MFSGTAPPSNKEKTRLLAVIVSFSSKVKRMRVLLSLKRVSLRRGKSQNWSHWEVKSMLVSCASLTRLGVTKSHWGMTEALTSAAKSLKLRWRAAREGMLATES